MFQLTVQEAAALWSQHATIKPGRGQHRKYLPYAFAEHGAIMAASVLIRGTVTLSRDYDLVCLTFHLIQVSPILEALWISSET